MRRSPTAIYLCHVASEWIIRKHCGLKSNWMRVRGQQRVALCTRARPTFVRNAGDFGNCDFPRLRVMRMRRSGKMAVQAFDAMKRVENGRK
jgi:hypothetical protein